MHQKLPYDQQNVLAMKSTICETILPLATTIESKLWSASQPGGHVNQSTKYQSDCTTSPASRQCVDGITFEQRSEVHHPSPTYADRKNINFSLHRHIKTSIIDSQHPLRDLQYHPRFSSRFQEVNLDAGLGGDQTWKLMRITTDNLQKLFSTSISRTAAHVRLIKTTLPSERGDFFSLIAEQNAVQPLSSGKSCLNILRTRCPYGLVS